MELSTLIPPSDHPLVIKVGGSLYDMPDLRDRLPRFLAALPSHHVVLVPGGGITADVVRRFHDLHQLDDEASHWLAVRCLAVNAHFLSTVLANSAVVERTNEVKPVLQAGKVGIFDVYQFAIDDEQNRLRLPHTWGVTSDSLAIRIAESIEAAGLVLLKSVDIGSISWAEAGRRGFVDPFFGEIVQRNPSLPVVAVNFRSWSP